MSNNVKNYFKQAGSGSDNDFIVDGNIEFGKDSTITSYGDSSLGETNYTARFNEFVYRAINPPVIYVRQESDFGVAVDGVITLANATYEIITTVAIDKQLSIPSLGNVKIQATQKLKDFLVYTGSSTFIVGDPQRLEIKDVVITGNASATFLNVTGATGVRSTLLFDKCLVTAFGTLGSITDILTFGAFNPDVSNYSTGFTVNNTVGEPDFIWSGGRIGNEPEFDTASTGITFTGTTSLINIHSCQVRLNTDQYAFKFDNSLTIQDDVLVSDCPVSYSVGGELIDPTGKQYDDVNITLSGNPNTRNSAHTGGFFITNNAIQTAISTINTYTSIGVNGTAFADNEGYSLAGSTLTSTSRAPTTSTIHISGSVIMASGSGKVISAGIFINDSLISEIQLAPDPTGTKPGVFSTAVSRLISLDDTIEIRFKNTSDTVNLIVQNLAVTVS